MVVVQHLKFNSPGFLSNRLFVECFYSLVSDRYEIKEKIQIDPVTVGICNCSVAMCASCNYRYTVTPLWKVVVCVRKGRRGWLGMGGGGDKKSCISCYWCCLLVLLAVKHFNQILKWPKIMKAAELSTVLFKSNESEFRRNETKCRAKFRSPKRNFVMAVPKCRAKFRMSAPHFANIRTTVSSKYHGKFASFEISHNFGKFHRNSLSLLLHSTVWYIHYIRCKAQYILFHNYLPDHFLQFFILTSSPVPSYSIYCNNVQEISYPAASFVCFFVGLVMGPSREGNVSTWLLVV